MNPEISEPAIADYCRPVVFFDGACALCRREIACYRRLDRQRNLRWVDISQEPQQVEVRGLAVDAALERFHVLDACGKWRVGANLPAFRWLSWVLSVSGTLPLLDRVYGVFDRRRLRTRLGENGALPGSGRPG